jgi:PmbA protein
VEEILALARRLAEKADVLLISSEETPVQFEANRLKNILSKQSTTLALRVVKDGRIGYASTTVLSNIDKLVNNAIETAQFGMPAKFELPGTTAYPEVAVFDSAVAAIPMDKMIELGEKMVSAVRNHTPEIVAEAEVTRIVADIHFMNSKGAQSKYRKSVFALGVGGALIRGTDMLFVGDGQSSCRPIEDIGVITRVVINQLELAKNNASVTSRQMPVIFTPQGVAEAFLPSLMSAFNGKIVLQGASPVGSKIGQQLFDNKFSLQDDPTLPYRPHSRICDDEGTPSQSTALITEGVVSGFLYDLQTAGLAGKKSTGNGSRGSGGLLSPSPSAFIIAPGNVAFTDMVTDIKEGLVIEQLMGAEQGNILGGDFSGNVLLGYKIENGKIVGRVKDTMVAGNIYQILKDIAAIGKDAKWLGGMMCTPHIYCPALSVSSKS